MEENQTLRAIPVDFVVEAGLKANATEAKRRPYISLISDWAGSEGMPEAAEPYVSRLRPEGHQDTRLNEKEARMMLKPRYRDDESMNLLKEILAELDAYITQNPGTWTWAHVMRVMKDGGILNTSINSQFDSLVCFFVPGKKKDSVRKNGDYMIMKPIVAWMRWGGDNSHVDNEVYHYTTCKAVYQVFKALIERQ